MSIFSTLIAHTIPYIPKSIVGYFARPYIAGEHLDDGVRVVKALNAKGIKATMDVLGESVTSENEALRMRGKCEEVLHAIEKNGLDSNLSIKPTQLGLNLDEALCQENLRFLCRIAERNRNFIRIDMEDHPYTDATIRIYRSLRREFPGAVGVVIQAYLFRSESDLLDLIADGQTNIRLCKGIYVEPASLAFKKKDEVRENYTKLTRLLLERGAYIGIATHDDVLLRDAKDLIKDLKLARDAYEFQMLLGVRPTTRDTIVSEGHTMRVYVPFGDQWYPYSTRRLKENPHMAMHIIKAIIGLNR